MQYFVGWVGGEGGSFEENRVLLFTGQGWHVTHLELETSQECVLIKDTFIMKAASMRECLLLYPPKMANAYLSSLG